MFLRTLAPLVFFSLLSCQPSNTTKKESKLSSKEFLQNANSELKEITYISSMAAWVHSNFITQDTTKISADYNARYSSLATKLGLESKKHRSQDLKEQRMLSLLGKVLTVPAPTDAKKNKELAQLKSELESLYGSGKFCQNETKCQNLGELEKIMAESRNPDELLTAWEGWRSVGFDMKSKFQRSVEIGNEGAKELGYSNMADLWRSKYDMKPQAFEKELDRLWGEVQPFYQQLHCYVRKKLNQKYGNAIVKPSEPIPAHLLGNMWAQSWTQIIDLVGNPKSKSIDITPLLAKAKYDSKKMVQTAENFFVSLGMPKLPKSFYERSLFVKPRDRDVACHASAWHMDLEDDVRIKMCIRINEEDFRVIHHELGHIYYYLAYNNQPPLFQDGANDGFHEALGDTVELSITGDYLKRIELLDKKQKLAGDVNQTLLNMALKKVAFLPFGLMIDKWRWQVFDGRTTPENYNKHWWDLRKKYQGIQAPRTRPAQAFDPGAKYHIPGYTPYSRYFLAHILQFQFHRALCKTAGHTGPLHECSIFGNKAAGDKLWSMMQMGSSQPWPDALAKATGSKKMDATALTEYFAPLKLWLEQQNQGLKCGW